VGVQVLINNEGNRLTRNKQNSLRYYRSALKKVPMSTMRTRNGIVLVFLVPVLDSRRDVRLLERTFLEYLWKYGTWCDGTQRR
jgi:hypothetical protein